MKFELKEFQQERGMELRQKLDMAWAEFTSSGEKQAVVFSSPTGSGKTITTAALLEWLFRGTEGHPARPYSRVLWISDAPELNVQSRDKILRACDQFGFHDLDTVDAAFDSEFLPAGKICFINTQLLGKDKKLTMLGDGRQFTFWQTVANTVRDFPGDLLLIIDEAHRGMGVSAVERNKRTTIIRKFIDGSPEDGLPPVPVVLGMSATTQRFDEFLAQSGRTIRKVAILPKEVQQSGLLKDTLVVVNPTGNVEGDMTLLEAAAKEWKIFDSLWTNYCEKQAEDPVRPILVVQVEDGVDNEDPAKRILTKTSLNEVVRVLARVVGPFKTGTLVHCFDKATEIVAGGEKIRKIDASRIQDDESARIVFFKTALSTGWDCPRAEVMMSFRKAIDHTLIAQLVGRMIRTPLARRIESDEVLNTVNLYLPHYDEQSLNQIVAELRNPDAEDRSPTNVETKTATYERSPDMDEVFTALEKLPTYSISRLRPLSPVKRLLRFTALLTIKDKLDLDAYDKARDSLIGVLVKHRDKKLGGDAAWGTVVMEGGEIELDISKIDLSDLGQPRHVRTIRATLTPENVHRLFESCNRIIAPGEGLAEAFWKKAHDIDEPDRAKLELYALVRDPAVIKELESLANTLFKKIESETRPLRQDFSEAKRMRYREILDRTGKPENFSWGLPERIVERAEGDFWKKHLYINQSGDFQTELNSWEAAVIREEMKRPDFVGWLRNRERANWALEIPYEHGGEKSFFPDFVIVRKSGKKLVLDIIEPHRPSESDTYAKAKGLAQYAKDHGDLFGRLILCKVDKKADVEITSSFDVNEPDTRDQVLKITSNNEIQGLYKP